MKSIKTNLIIFIIIFASFWSVQALEWDDFIDDFIGDIGFNEFWTYENEGFPWENFEENNEYNEFWTYESRKLMSWEAIIPTLESNSELEITNEEGSIEITQLPTTWPETVLLLIISFLVTSFILFKNKNQKI